MGKKIHEKQLLKRSTENEHDIKSLLLEFNVQKKKKSSLLKVAFTNIILVPKVCFMDKVFKISF